MDSTRSTHNFALSYDLFFYCGNWSPRDLGGTDCGAIVVTAVLLACVSFLCRFSTSTDSLRLVGILTICCYLVLVVKRILERM